VAVAFFSSPGKENLGLELAGLHRFLTTTSMRRWTKVQSESHQPSPDLNDVVEDEVDEDPERISPEIQRDI
jgi:hypothetical protein